MISLRVFIAFLFLSACTSKQTRTLDKFKTVDSSLMQNEVQKVDVEITGKAWADYQLLDSFRIKVEEFTGLIKKEIDSTENWRVSQSDLLNNERYASVADIMFTSYRIGLNYTKDVAKLREYESTLKLNQSVWMKRMFNNVPALAVYTTFKKLGNDIDTIQASIVSSSQ
jgi:hypothetical protein